jgi:hypothetical protein
MILLLFRLDAGSAPQLCQSSSAIFGVTVAIKISLAMPMGPSCIGVRRSSEDGVYCYHVSESYPPGHVDNVFLWRTLDGYFGMITALNGERSIRFDEYNNWTLLKNDLLRCLHEELQCPAFDEDRLRPPLLRRFQDFR